MKTNITILEPILESIKVLALYFVTTTTLSQPLLSQPLLSQPLLYYLSLVK